MARYVGAGTTRHWGLTKGMLQRLYFLLLKTIPSLLATSHVAAVSDEVNDSSRSQAIALLRTSGDIGYLCGAACAGISADLVGDVATGVQRGLG